MGDEQLPSFMGISKPFFQDPGTLTNQVQWNATTFFSHLSPMAMVDPLFVDVIPVEYDTIPASYVFLKFFFETKGRLIWQSCLRQVFHQESQVNCLGLREIRPEYVPYQKGVWCLRRHWGGTWRIIPARNCLITMVIVSPLRIGLWDPLLNGRFMTCKWGWS